MITDTLETLEQIEVLEDRIATESTAGFLERKKTRDIIHILELEQRNATQSDAGFLDAAIRFGH